MMLAAYGVLILMAGMLVKYPTSRAAVADGGFSESRDWRKRRDSSGSIYPRRTLRSAIRIFRSVGEADSPRPDRPCRDGFH